MDTSNTISCMCEIFMQQKTIVKRRWETDLSAEISFGDLFLQIAPLDKKEDSCKAKIGYKSANKEPGQWVEVRLDQKVKLLTLQGGNIVKFELVPQQIPERSSTSRNAFDVLMEKKVKKHLPDHVTESTAKDELFNNILDTINDHNPHLGFSNVETTGTNFVKYLRDVIWYLDPNWKTLTDAIGLKIPDFVLKVYQTRSGRQLGDLLPYNNYLLKKKPKPIMKQENLDMFVQSGAEYLNTVWLVRSDWKLIKEALCVLVETMKKYAGMLKEKNIKMKERYSRKHPVREPIKDGQCYTIEKIDSIPEQVGILDEIMKGKERYEPIFLTDHPEISKLTKYQRHHLFEKLVKDGGLSQNVTYFKYTPYSGITTYHFLWVIPEREERNNSTQLKLCKEIESSIPVYHTRTMKAQFKENFSAVCSLKPSIRRAMYQYLTDDASSAANNVTKEVDRRLHLAINSNDPDLAFDLRELNLGRHAKYDPFWEGLQKVLDRDFPPAAEERRHGESIFLPVAVSIKDLIQKVTELSPGIDVPSESWVLLQFTPKNRNAHTSLNYTSRFEITYKVQSRSHHSKHPDTYYCMSLYKYLRSFAVLYRLYVNFICEDDKHAVNVGDPGTPLATLMRAKKVMTLKGQEPQSSDHDWHRFKLTPSVLLHNSIPDSVDETFYSGKAFVTLKNAVFQKSSPFRHQIEKEEVINNWTPIECTYSDGGPDHNPRHYSVKLAQLSHFLRKDLDMSIAVVTYPGGSYVDPAERVMPLLNIAMQGVSLCRTEMAPVFEKALKNVNSMEGIREVCKDDQELTNAVIKSVQPCIDVLNERFPRVSLKGEPLSVGAVASDDKVSKSLDVIHEIDETVTIEKTTKKDISKCYALNSYLKHHSCSRRYMFQIRKCMNAPVNFEICNEVMMMFRIEEMGAELWNKLHELVYLSAKTVAHLKEVISLGSDNINEKTVEEFHERILGEEGTSCNICSPPRLPIKEFINLSWLPDPTPKEAEPEKYQKFKELYRKETKEVFRPSFSEDNEKTDKEMMVATKVQSVLNCVSCSKPRVIYAESKVWKKELDTISRQIETIHYDCGGELFEEGHPLYNKVAMRTLLKCDDSIEYQYFSSKKFSDVCFFCGSNEWKFCQPPDEVKNKYNDIYPLCENCKSLKKIWHTKRPKPDFSKKK